MRRGRALLLAGWFVPIFAATHLVSGAPANAPPADGPDPAAVQRFGAAYRYPQAGWTVLHIEGEPYERGYQHGQLLWTEIAGYVHSLATERSPKSPADGWRSMRLLVNALFLRGYDGEYLEEMKGIADGAAAAGAKFDGRKLDLLDIVTLNSGIEVEFLESGLEASPHGLEAKRFSEPATTAMPPNPPEHCSAFAATGPATADGKIVFGHITMFTLYQVRHFNVWLDVKPKSGHRVLMQTFPGGIMSGMDYYLNDAGILVAETTIKQTRFNSAGSPLCSRIRKALQYGDSIDYIADELRRANNGLYTNEWLLGDTKTNEIAMFELGTHKSKLWRSSKNEWLAGAEGFYWGCNNTKDLDVRLETLPSLAGKPANVVFRPSDRDKVWLSMYERHKGKIGEDFGFEAFTTPPLAAFRSCDAKFTTSALAKDLKTWALFGPPLGKAWDATPEELRKFRDIRSLVSNDWTMLTSNPPPAPPFAPQHVVDLVPEPPKKDRETPIGSTASLPAAWRGTLLPKSDADVWLVTAFAEYEKIVSLEKALLDKSREEKSKEVKLDEQAQDRLNLALYAYQSKHLSAVRRVGKDIPLADTRSESAHSDWYDIAVGKGVLLLDRLKRKIGSHEFQTLMDEFGEAHAGKETSAEEFVAHVEKSQGSKVHGCFDAWLHGQAPDIPGGAWSIFSFEDEPQQSLIVYGTLKESQAQKEAATLLARQLARRWSNVSIPVVADSEVTSQALSSHHILLVGRPDSNSAAAELGKALPVAFGPRSIALEGKTYANPGTAVVVAGDNPLNRRYSVVIYAGLSAEATWNIPSRLPTGRGETAEILLLPAGRKVRAMIAPVVQTPAATKTAANP